MSTPEHPDNSKQAEKLSLGAKVAWGSIPLLSALSTFLALLGYGVALAVETVFDIPHAAMYGSFVELVDLSSLALNQIISGASKVSVVELLKRAYVDRGEAFLMLLGIGAALTVLTCIWLRHRKGGVRADASPGPAKERSLPIWLLPASITAMIGAAPVIAFACAWVVVLLLSMFTVVPFIGHEAGRAFITEWVVKPDRCMPVRNRDQRLAPIHETGKREQVAQCVVIDYRDGTHTMRGRVVASTSSVIVLFDPRTGDVERFSLTNGRLRLIGDLGGTPPAAP